MQIDINASLDLTAIPLDGEPELFFSISSEFGEGEIYENIALDMYAAVDDAFDSHIVNGEFASNEDENALIDIVYYLEGLAAYARDRLNACN